LDSTIPAGCGPTSRQQELVNLAQPSFAARGMAMAKSGVKPLIFLIAVSVMAWVAGMAIHGF
jgi:hypothetical protein